VAIHTPQAEGEEDEELEVEAILKYRQTKKSVFANGEK
jgi:hypothetical protein